MLNYILLLKTFIFCITSRKAALFVESLMLFLYFAVDVDGSTVSIILQVCVFSLQPAFLLDNDSFTEMVL